MSILPICFKIFRAFSAPIRAGTLPQTTVMPRISSSGDASANISARVSSIPGSQSIMTFFAAFILQSPFLFLFPPCGGTRYLVFYTGKFTNQSEAAYTRLRLYKCNSEYITDFSKKKPLKVSFPAFVNRIEKSTLIYRVLFIDLQSCRHYPCVRRFELPTFWSVAKRSIQLS